MEQYHFKADVNLTINFEWDMMSADGPHAEIEALDWLYARLEAAARAANAPLETFVIAVHPTDGRPTWQYVAPAKPRGSAAITLNGTAKLSNREGNQ